MVDKKRFSSDNLYTVLGVGFDADHSEIKKMYQELVLKVVWYKTYEIGLYSILVFSDQLHYLDHTT